MGAHKSKDPRFRASIERGSKIFRRAVLDTDREYRNRRGDVPKSREETNKQSAVNKKQDGLNSYSSLEGLNRRGIPEVKTEEVPNVNPEEVAKASLWDGDVSFEDGGTGFRPRSSTYDGPHDRNKRLSVHFASNLVSTRPSSHKSTGDIHLKGILRHDSAYERNKKLYENHFQNAVNKNSNETNYPSRNPHQRLTRKHRQRSSSLENIRTRTQKTVHTDYINQQLVMDSPTIIRKSRKDNHLQPTNQLTPARVKGTGSSRYHGTGDISPSRSPVRASPAKSVKSTAPHNSRDHNSTHHGYTNSPFSQRRLMLMSL